MPTFSANKTVVNNNPLSQTSRGVLYVMLAVVVWSGNFIVGRALIYTVPPITLAFFRWTLAFIVLLPFVWTQVMQSLPTVKKHWLFFIIISAIGVSYFNTAIYFAAHTTSALNMSFIALSGPLFTMLWARILYQEHLTRRQIIGVGITLAGVVCLISKGDMDVLLNLSFGVGDLLMLTSSLGFSIYTIMLRKVPVTVKPLAFLAITFGIGSLILSPFFIWDFFIVATPIPYSFSLAAIFMYLAVGPSIISFFAWGKALQCIGATKTSILYYTLPLFCGVEAVFLLGEPVLWVHLFSGILIVGGMVIATLRKA